MSSPISPEAIYHLAQLARIELTSEEKNRLLADLQKILGHFEELQKLDLSGVEPLTGDTLQKNVFREDGERTCTNSGKGRESFPSKHNGYLKVPPVFPTEGGSASGGEE